MSEKMDLSPTFFEWQLEHAIKNAIAKHGDIARIVGWDVMQDFKSNLPKGRFVCEDE